MKNKEKGRKEDVEVSTTGTKTKQMFLVVKQHNANLFLLLSALCFPAHVRVRTY